MNCRKCGAVARMSRRRGLKEGVFDRLMLRAVHRCLECGLRFHTYSPGLAFRKTRQKESISEYLGYGDERGRRILQNAVLVVLLLLIGIVGIMRFQKTKEPKTINVDASGKRIK